MAVKVVSEKPVRTRRVVCGKCSYELEYTGVDVHAGTYSCMGEGNDWHYIVCPLCEEKTEVKPWA